MDVDSEYAGESGPFAHKAPVLVLYAGPVAQAAAMELHTDAMEGGFQSNIAPLKLFKKVGFLSTPMVLMLGASSDWGAAGPTAAFQELISRGDLPPAWLRGLHYTCVGSPVVAARLQALGATRMFADVEDMAPAEAAAAIAGKWAAFPDGDVDEPKAKMPKVAAAAPAAAPTPAAVAAAAAATTLKRSRVDAAEDDCDGGGGGWMDDAADAAAAVAAADTPGADAALTRAARTTTAEGGGKAVKVAPAARARTPTPPGRVVPLAGLMAPPPPAPKTNGIATTTPSAPAARSESAAACTTPGKDTHAVVFMYASEAGNAEAICGELQRETKEAGYVVRGGKMNDFERLEWAGRDVGAVVLVASTTGDGELPDNGKKFLRYLKKKAPEGSCAHVRFALLALGDQNYDKFCGAGKAVEAALLKVGGTQFVDSGYADDGVGLELVIEPWRVELQKALKVLYTTPAAVPAAAPTTTPTPVATPAQPQAPTYPPLRTRKVLFLYASETGNAESIARDLCTGLAAAIEARGGGVACACFNDAARLEWEDQRSTAACVLVVSTIGDGEIPDNGRRTLRTMKKQIKAGAAPAAPNALPPYALLALGDQNYDKFCGAGKDVQAAMTKLGWTAFCEPGFADDGVGLDVVVEPWREALRAAFEACFFQTSSADASGGVESAPAASAAPAPAASVAEFTHASSKSVVDFAASPPTLTLHLTLEKASERLGPRFEQDERTKALYAAACKKDSLCEKLGVRKGMDVVSVDGELPTGEAALQKAVDALRKNLKGTIVFALRAGHVDELKELAPAPAAPAASVAVAPVAAPAPAASVAEFTHASSKSVVDFAASPPTLTLHLTLEKASERLGPRFEQDERTKALYAAACKKDSLCEKLGVRKGMDVVSVDGELPTGEAALQKAVDALRKNLKGTIVFALRAGHVDELKELAPAAPVPPVAATTPAPAAPPAAPVSPPAVNGGEGAAAPAAAADPIVRTAGQSRSEVDLTADPPLLTVHLKLEKASERLGPRFEQAEASKRVVCASVKKESLADQLGVRKGMAVVACDGEEVAGEISLQKAIEQMRKRLVGTLVFALRDEDVEELEEAYGAGAQEGAKSPPIRTTPLNGAVLAAASPSPLTPAKPAAVETVAFMYASETGNAEAICRSLLDIATGVGFPTTFGKLNDHAALGWALGPGEARAAPGAGEPALPPAAQLAILVVSTTGDGEMPDSGKKFLRALKKRVKDNEVWPAAAAPRFALLCLGDQNYDKFCGAGKVIEAHLVKLGAMRVCDTGYADDGTGLEVVVEPWKAVLKKTLAKRLADATAKPAVEVNGSPADSHAAPQKYLDKAKYRLANAHKRRILVLYASETGNAQAIATGLAEVAANSGIAHECKPANAYKDVHFERYTYVVFVIATTGDGTFTENSRKFCAWLGKDTQPADLLKHMKFAMLALGDRNYPKFCNAGKQVEERMLELGATKFYQSGYADDGVGLEVVVEPWKQKLWPALLSLWEGDQLSLSPGLAPLLKASPSPAVTPLMRAAAPPPMPADAVGVPALSERSGSVRSGRDGTSKMSERSGSEMSFGYEVRHGQLNPFYAKIASYKQLTADDFGDAPTYRLTFDVAEWGHEWAPGDAIGICPCNDNTLVDAMLVRLRCDPHEQFKRPTGMTPEELMARPQYELIRFPLTNRQALLRHVDFTVRRPDMLRFLANQCADVKEKERLHAIATSPRLFRDHVVSKRMTILEVLEDYPSCQPSLRDIVEHAATLQPRYYSVASARVSDRTTLDICFKVEVHHLPNKRRVPGVCTTWLESLIKSMDASPSVIAVPIFLKTTPEFNAPEDISRPVIMIGPGTGVAPFIAFLQYRQYQMQRVEQRGKILATMPAQGGTAEVLEARLDNTRSGNTPVEKYLTAGAGAQSLVGETHLFFGCRSRENDYLYRDELEDFVDNQTLRYLHTAFSQEEDDAYWYGGVYVQDKMMDISVRLATLICHRNAYIYVCGDAKSMAKDVHRILIEILVDSKRMSTNEAKQLLKQMQDQGRYQRDIW